MKFLRMTDNVTPSPLSLSALREIVSVMRELGVQQWGDIVLGAAPMAAQLAPVVTQDQHASATPETGDDDYVKTLLHSSGANPGPFLRKVPTHADR